MNAMIKSFLKKMINKKFKYLLIIVIGIILIFIAQKQLVGIALTIALIVSSIFILFAIFKYISNSIKENALRDKENEILRNENEKLNQEKGKLEIENVELKNMHINITQVTPILELGMFKAKCKVKRLVEKYYWEDNKKQIVDDEILEQINLNPKLALKNLKYRKFFKFTGVMDFDLDSVYGVELQHIRVKPIHDRKKILVFGAFPKRISYKNLPEAEWDFHQCLKVSDPLIGKFHWMTDDKFDSFKAELMISERKEYITNVNERGIEELKWLQRPLQDQVKNLLHLMFFPKDYEIIIENGNNTEAITINKYLNGDQIEYNKRKLLSQYSNK